MFGLPPNVKAAPPPTGLLTARRASSHPDHFGDAVDRALAQQGHGFLPPNVKATPTPTGLLTTRKDSTHRYCPGNAVDRALGPQGQSTSPAVGAPSLAALAEAQRSNEAALEELGRTVSSSSAELRADIRALTGLVERLALAQDGNASAGAAGRNEGRTDAAVAGLLASTGQTHAQKIVTAGGKGTPSPLLPHLHSRASARSSVARASARASDAASRPSWTSCVGSASPFEFAPELEACGSEGAEGAEEARSEGRSPSRARPRLSRPQSRPPMAPTPGSQRCVFAEPPSPVAWPASPREPSRKAQATKGLAMCLTRHPSVAALQRHGSAAHLGSMQRCVSAACLAAAEAASGAEAEGASEEELLPPGAELGTWTSQRRRTCSERLMLDPHSLKRALWDAVVLVAVTWTALFVPILLGFEYVPGSASTAYELLIDALCALDVALAFRTGYRVDGWVQLAPAAVAARYVATWFAFDAAGAVPWQLLASVLEAGGASKAVVFTVHGLKAVRLVKLVRLSDRVSKVAA